jgi:hypothetical protein
MSCTCRGYVAGKPKSRPAPQCNTKFTPALISLKIKKRMHMQRLRGWQLETSSTELKRKTLRDYVDAAGNPKSVVRKCSENLKNIDKLYEGDVVSSLVLTDDTELSCFEDMVWFSKSCRCVCVYERASKSSRVRSSIEEIVWSRVSCRRESERATERQSDRARLIFRERERESRVPGVVGCVV